MIQAAISVKLRRAKELSSKHREDWGLDDPSGKVDSEFIRTAILIEEKVLDLKLRIQDRKLDFQKKNK